MCPKPDFAVEMSHFFELSVDLLCISGPDGIFKKVNPSFTRVLGYTENELLSVPFLSFVHPDDISATLKIVEELAAGKKTVDFENRYKKKDGTHLILSWSATPDPRSGFTYAIARDVTLQREKESRQNQVLSAVNENAIIAYTDLAGTITDVNKNFCEISGYSREELTGKNHRIINSGAHPKTFFNDLWKTISSGRAWRGMIENKSKSGENYFVQSMITPLRDILGNVDGYMAVRFDVTKLRKTEIENQKLSLRIEEAEVVAKIGFWKFNLVNNEIEWSRGMYELLGVGEGEVTPSYESYAACIHPDDRERMNDTFARILNEKMITHTFEYRVVHQKDHAVRWIKIHGVLNLDSGSNPIRMHGTAQDITESKLKEIEIEKAINVLNETGNLAKIGGWELDIATGALNWTDETFRILEVEKKNGQNPKLPEGLALFTPESAPIIDQAVKRAIEFGEPYSLEVQALTAKGNVVWVYTNGQANWRDGKIVTLSGTIQNIDQRVRKDLELKNVNHKLIQSSKLASLGVMSAGIAHEINNPLAIIMSSMELVTKYQDAPEKLAPLMERVKKSTDRIARIVRGLKKFSRTGDGPEFAHHSFAVICEEALLLTESKSKTHGVPVTFECLTKAEINCDEVEIEQVLVNLISNSVDAVKDNEEKWIRVVAEEDAKTVIVRITDSGKGIPKEVKEKLFEPFFTTKDVGEGTGLGLSITKGILDTHGASIALLEAKPNTCFEIRFPRLKAENHGN